MKKIISSILLLSMMSIATGITSCFASTLEPNKTSTVSSKVQNNNNKSKEGENVSNGLNNKS